MYAYRVDDRGVKVGAGAVSLISHGDAYGHRWSVRKAAAAAPAGGGKRKREEAPAVIELGLDSGSDGD